MAGLSALSLHSFPAISSASLDGTDSDAPVRVPFGVCDHSLRAMQVNADYLIDYAIEHKLDAVQLNSFRPLDSRDDKYLGHLREKAAANGIGFYLGAGSISDHSTRFRDDYGTGRDLLREGIRVATALSSPIVVCRIGTMEDRFTEGGIEPHIEAVIKTMNSLRSEALDAGVKFAFENHAVFLETRYDNALQPGRSMQAIHLAQPRKDFPERDHFRLAGYPYNPNLSLSDQDSYFSSETQIQIFV